MNGVYGDSLFTVAGRGAGENLHVSVLFPPVSICPPWLGLRAAQVRPVPAGGSPAPPLAQDSDDTQDLGTEMERNSRKSPGSAGKYREQNADFVLHAVLERVTRRRVLVACFVSRGVGRVEARCN